MATPMPTRPSAPGDPPGRPPRRRLEPSWARALAWLLVVAGALLIWPVDALLGAEVAAIGVLLIALGLGGALAARSGARGGRARR